MNAKLDRIRDKIADEQGASIVIALVFFLICGVVGSVVVTAASVQAKSVQTHQDMQQDEYTMQSAADLVAHQLGGIDVSSGQTSVQIGVSYDDEKNATANLRGVVSSLGQGFWTNDRTNAILASRADHRSYIVGGSGSQPIVINPPTSSTLISEVYARITVDPDLNMAVELSLSSTFAQSSPYNMTVNIQCTPTYDISGQLVGFAYGDNTVIEKM